MFNDPLVYYSENKSFYFEEVVITLDVIAN
jgi:hypothetical protein